MSDGQRKARQMIPVFIALALVAVIAVPIALVGCALLEDAWLGTNYMEQFARLTGTTDAFEWLYAALQPILGW
jgi:hypothetical protein